MARQDPERTLERAKKAFVQHEQWTSLMQDVYEYAMPQRSEYATETQGAKKTSKVFDSTAIRGTKKGSSRIVSEVFPPGQQWGKLEAGPLVPEDQRAEVNKALEQVNKTLFDVIGNTTNFQTAIGEFALDLFAGTGTMLINPGDEESPIVYEAIPPIHCALEEGANGRVWGVYRKPKVKARNLQSQWPTARITGELAKLVNDEPDKDVPDLMEATYYEPSEKRWCYEVLWKKGEAKAEKVVDLPYASSPWIAARWAKSSNEVNGRGPLLDAHPDVKTINKLVELTLMNAALAVSGVYTGVDDGVMNPDTVRIAPGSIVAVARNQGHPSGPSLAPLERAGDFEVSQIEHERLYTSINDILMNNSMPPMEGAVRSATEFLQRMRELASDMGAAFGRLHSEVMVPIVQRSLDILVQKGIIRLPPNITRIVVGGANIKLTVLSPIAQLQSMNEVEAIARTLELSGALVGKDLTMLALKLEDVPETIATKLGFPSGLIRNKTEKQQLLQMVAGIMAAAQANGEGSLTQVMQGVGQGNGMGMRAVS